MAMVGSYGEAEPVWYRCSMKKLADMKLLVRALEFAAQKHRMQRRKDIDTSPYINHPIALVHVLCLDADIADPVILAAAALHDTIEDTETTPAELEREFGVEITRIVVEMTDDKSLPKAERKQLQIAHAAHKSHEGSLVKLADKICNLRDVAKSPPTGWSLERQREYFEWANAVVQGLPRVNQTLLELFDAAYAMKP